AAIVVDLTALDHRILDSQQQDTFSSGNGGWYRRLRGNNLVNCHMVDVNVRIHQFRVRLHGIAPIIPQLDAGRLAIGYLAATDGNAVVSVTQGRAVHSIIEHDPASRVAG